MEYLGAGATLSNLSSILFCPLLFLESTWRDLDKFGEDMRRRLGECETLRGGDGGSNIRSNGKGLKKSPIFSRLPPRDFRIRGVAGKSWRTRNVPVGWDRLKGDMSLEFVLITDDSGIVSERDRVPDVTLPPSSCSTASSIHSSASSSLCHAGRDFEITSVISNCVELRGEQVVDHVIVTVDAWSHMIDVI
jgi:hypothetical protein